MNGWPYRQDDKGGRKETWMTVAARRGGGGGGLHQIAFLEQMLVFFLSHELNLPASPGGTHSVFSSTDKKMSLGACLIVVHLPLKDLYGHGEELMVPTC